MVLFDREEIVPVALQNRLTECSVGVQRICGDQTPLECQVPQEHLGRCHLLPLARSLELIQHRCQRRPVSRDQMEAVSRLVRVVRRRPAHRLSIQDNLILRYLAPSGLGQRHLQGRRRCHQPPLEGLLKRPRVQIPHQPKHRPTARGPRLTSALKPQRVKHLRMILGAPPRPVRDALIPSPTTEHPDQQKK